MRLVRQWISPNCWVVGIELCGDGRDDLLGLENPIPPEFRLCGWMAIFDVCACRFVDLQAVCTPWPRHWDEDLRVLSRI